MHATAVLHAGTVCRAHAANSLAPEHDAQSAGHGAVVLLLVQRDARLHAGAPLQACMHAEKTAIPRNQCACTNIQSMKGFHGKQEEGFWSSEAPTFGICALCAKAAGSRVIICSLTVECTLHAEIYFISCNWMFIHGCVHENSC